MWIRVLGPDFDLSKLSRRQWGTFIRLRRTGAIDPRGNPNEKKRKPVGDRTIERDLCFLRALCRWACDFRDDAGHLLLEHDPTRGLEIPRERNPAREVATHDRVDAIRKVYRRVKMRVQRAFKREVVESYLPEIFEIVVGTGRRISAVCSLRVENVELEPTADAPWGVADMAHDLRVDAPLSKTWSRIFGGTSIDSIYALASDAQGNLLVTAGSGAEHVVFVAHMDEVGFQIVSLFDDGRLLVRPRGGLDLSLWEAQTGLVHTAEGAVPAVF